MNRKEELQIVLDNNSYIEEDDIILFDCERLGAELVQEALEQGHKDMSDIEDYVNGQVVNLVANIFERVSHYGCEYLQNNDDIITTTDREEMIYLLMDLGEIKYRYNTDVDDDIDFITNDLEIAIRRREIPLFNKMFEQCCDNVLFKREHNDDFCSANEVAMFEKYIDDITDIIKATI